MNPAQLEEVIKAIPDLHLRKWNNLDIEYLFRTLYWCALRPIEGINLKKDDFDLDEKQVYLGRTKTTKQDYAPIPDPFLRSLKGYLHRKPKGKLFDARNKDPLTYDTFYVWLKKLGKLCNIPAWTEHNQGIPNKDGKITRKGEKTVGHIFRKSIGKDMVYGTHGTKFPINIISKQLRHSNIATTMNSYLKVELESVKEAWADNNELSKYLEDNDQ